MNAKIDIWEFNNDCEEDRTGKKTSLEQSKVKGARQGMGVKLGKLPREYCLVFLSLTCKSGFYKKSRRN